MYAFLVDAMQNDLIIEGRPNEIGPLSREIVPGIQRVLKTVRGKGIPVVYVNDCHFPNDPFVVGVGRPEHCIQGTPGYEVIDELAPEKGDFIIDRRKLSGFFATDLDIILRDVLKAKTIVMTGVVIEFGMYVTIFDALQLGYDVIILSDCCATRSEERRDWALKLLEFLHNVSIITADEFIEKIS